MNPFLWRIVAWSNSFPWGTPNSVIASAATRRGVISEYKRHLGRFQAACIDPGYIAVNLYRDDVLIERLINQEPKT